MPPYEATLRTAILVGGFRETRFTRLFPGGWSDSVAKFRPDAIAAPLEILRKLAAGAENVTIGHAVVAFTSDTTQVLSDSDRDLFWHVFGVPVFEQYLGVHNQLLAFECEAHAGLHVVSAYSGVRLDRSRCACGDASPRLLRALPLPVLEPVLVS